MKHPESGSDGRIVSAQARMRITLLELWLGLCRTLVGSHRKTALALAALGAAHDRLGHYDIAIGQLEEALTMMTAARGHHHPDVLPLSRCFMPTSRRRIAG